MRKRSASSSTPTDASCWCIATGSSVRSKTPRTRCRRPCWRPGRVSAGSRRGPRCAPGYTGARQTSSRRPRMSAPTPGFDPPEPTRLGEVVWLEPYPDVLLERLTDTAAGPEARDEAKQAISLAFVTAVQLLPPRQRAVLILRDVLGFRAGEVADILESTEESVTSALKRARATLRRRLPQRRAQEPPPPPASAVEQDLVERLTRAFETSDVDGVVALLTADASLTMPPLPRECQGRESAARFQAAVFRPGRFFRLVATRANGQPAF